MQYGIINDSSNAVHYSPWLIYFITEICNLYILITFSHFRLVVTRGRRWGYLQFCFVFWGPSWNANMLWKLVSKFYMYQVGTDWLWAFLLGPQTFTRLVSLVASEYSPGRSARSFHHSHSHSQSMSCEPIYLPASIGILAVAVSP